MLLLPLAGCARTDTPSPEGFRDLWDVLTDNTAKRNVLRMEDTADADERWMGIEFLVDHTYGRKPPYTTRYAQVATTDPDHVVRAYAVRALNRSRDAAAVDAFIAALDDEHPMVRLEAAKALGNVPDSRAVPALLRHLGPTITPPPDGADTARPALREETMDVRVAVAKALRHYRSADVARALVDALDERDFAVAYYARTSLQEITGADHAYDEAAWLAYLTGPGKPLG